MKDPNNPCLFCNSEESGCAHENDLAYASYDSYPVSEYHCLIIPKRHVKEYFDLSEEEVIGCNQLLKNIKKKVENDDKSIKGFNIGNIFIIYKNASLIWLFKSRNYSKQCCFPTSTRTQECKKFTIFYT